MSEEPRLGSNSSWDLSKPGSSGAGATSLIFLRL